MLLAALFVGHVLLIKGSFFFSHWLFHPLVGRGYQFYSGVLGDIPEIGILFAGIGILKHLNCDAPRCFRYGPHRTADGHSKLCRVHHPDLPNHRLSLKEISARHHKARLNRVPTTDA
jgi:hypothetical protein